MILDPMPKTKEGLKLARFAFRSVLLMEAECIIGMSLLVYMHRWEVVLLIFPLWTLRDMRRMVRGWIKRNQEEIDGNQID